MTQTLWKQDSAAAMALRMREDIVASVFLFGLNLVRCVELHVLQTSAPAGILATFEHSTGTT